MFMRSFFPLSGLVCLLAACSADTTANNAADTTDGEDQALSGKDFEIPIKFKKDLTKTFSFSKDFGSGENTFAATAIFTGSAGAHLDGALKLHVDSSLIKGGLQHVHGELTGKWDAEAEFDINLALTGKAGANDDFVRDMTKTAFLPQNLATNPMITSQISLGSVPVGSTTIGVASIDADVELQLVCNLSASANFNAKATAGVTGNVEYNVDWDKSQTNRGGIDGATNHWSASPKGTNVMVSPPKFTVGQGDAKFHARCGIRPSVNLTIDVGNDEKTGAEAGAKIGGEIYAEANGDLDGKAGTAELDWDIGLQGTLEVFAKASAFGRPLLDVDRTIPFFGGPQNPKHLTEKHLQGKIGENLL